MSECGAARETVRLQTKSAPVRRRDSGIFAIVRVDAPVAEVTPIAVARALSPEIEEEAKLVARMIANQPAAWREFQTRYDRLILRCITKVTKRFAAVSQEDVREIYAQLIVSLLANDKNKLRTFDPARGNRFSSWIGLLAIHGAYDHLRAVKREPQKEALAEACDLPAETEDPYEHAEKRQRADIAARVLEGFSERDRAFAALYFGEGMAPEEIALRMNISVKTVYSKKHKIQSRLEAMLGVGAASIA